MSPAELAIMRRIDELHLDCPFAGSRMFRDPLRGQGVQIGQARVIALMNWRGRGDLSAAEHLETRAGHKIYPYLLCGLTFDRPEQVWQWTSANSPGSGLRPPGRRDRLAHAPVLAWRVTMTLEVDFWIEAVEEALARHGKPEIFNAN